MTFLNFSQLSESVFRPNFPRKHFPGNQAKFFFNWKIFSVDLLSNSKQTQESLKSGFPETTFQETNMALILVLIVSIFLIYKTKFYL
jgi:uncharacterized protein YcbX